MSLITDPSSTSAPWTGNSVTRQMKKGTKSVAAAHILEQFTTVVLFNLEKVFFELDVHQIFQVRNFCSLFYIVIFNLRISHNQRRSVAFYHKILCACVRLQILLVHATHLQRILRGSNFTSDEIVFHVISTPLKESKVSICRWGKVCSYISKQSRFNTPLSILKV